MHVQLAQLHGKGWRSSHRMRMLARYIALPTTAKVNMVADTPSVLPRRQFLCSCGMRPLMYSAHMPQPRQLPRRRLPARGSLLTMIACELLSAYGLQLARPWVRDGRTNGIRVHELFLQNVKTHYLHPYAVATQADAEVFARAAVRRQAGQEFQGLLQGWRRASQRQP